MKVFFIGAGPGDPELITRKGWRLLQSCSIILYTGSLVPSQLISKNLDITTGKQPEIIDSAGLVLDEICAIFQRAKNKNQNIARVHTGDPTIFASVAEQIRCLQQMDIDFEVIPGVSSFTAAAACLGKELTLPQISQTVILTRVEGRTKMPSKETLSALAKHETTLVLFLSINLLPKVCEQLLPILGPQWPIAIVGKASIQSEETIIQGRLQTIIQKWKDSKVRSQAIIILGKILESKDFADSQLYNKNFFHSFRPPKKII